MMPDWLWPALAMVLIIEGLGPLLFPNRWQAYLRKLAAEPVAHLQQLGIVLVSAGALWLWWLL
jgi:uncharacterized protein YjeT (DUF2065 family)